MKFKLLVVEPRWFKQDVKEAIHIRMERPSLNKDGGNYNHPSIWNNVSRSCAQVHQIGLAYVRRPVITAICYDVIFSN